MSESCSGNCSNCGSDCASRQPESLLAPANAHSNVKKVIAVVSGKGGVGKSTVTSLLAVAMHKLGYKTAILDADITGPSAGVWPAFLGRGQRRGHLPGGDRGGDQGHVDQPAARS